MGTYCFKPMNPVTGSVIRLAMLEKTLQRPTFQTFNRIAWIHFECFLQKFP